jgi:hypothetical protein
MPAKYSIVQYTPDPVTGERINIGVIAFDEEFIRVRFVSKWDRVRQFANQDIRFLKAFAQELTESASTALLLPGLERYPKLTQDRVEAMAGNWINTIQLTEPRASLKSVDELLSDVAARFLSEPIRNKRGFRDRRAAVSLATSRIRHALIQRVGDEDAEDLLKQQAALQGKRQPHTFDAVVANGVPYFAVHGISFELPEARILKFQIDAAAWSIADVHEYDQTFPIGVMTLPPLSDEDELPRLEELYRRTIKVYTELGATVLTEQDIETWAQQMAQRIPLE